MGKLSITSSKTTPIQVKLNEVLDDEVAETCALCTCQQEPITIEVIKEVIKEVIVEVPVEVIKTVEVEKIVTVVETVQVPVDKIVERIIEVKVPVEVIKEKVIIDSKAMFELRSEVAKTNRSLNAYKIATCILCLACVILGVVCVQ